MADSTIKKVQDGREFQLLGDRVLIKSSAKETDGAYSFMHWTAAPGATALPHAHERYEETFYVLNGELSFLLGEKTAIIAIGDFVRVPAGVRHGYKNLSADPVDMLVTFIPGGMEELFYKYRTDERDFDAQSYLHEAKTIHGTEYELVR